MNVMGVGDASVTRVPKATRRLTKRKMEFLASQRTMNFYYRFIATQKYSFDHTNQRNKIKYENYNNIQ